MFRSNKLANRLAPAFAAAIAFASWGCGDDSGLSKRYPVSGKVTLKGEAVPDGRIDFVNDDPEGRAASGQIVNGSYTLTTATENDGALPGKYKVTVSAVEVDTAEMKKIAGGGQFHHDDAFFKATKNAKNLVPARYKLADTSELTAEVAESSNTINFDLAE